MGEGGSDAGAATGGDISAELPRCGHCSRPFRKERLAKHEETCKKKTKAVGECFAWRDEERRGGKDTTCDMLAWLLEDVRSVAEYARACLCCRDELCNQCTYYIFSDSFLFSFT